MRKNILWLAILLASSLMLIQSPAFIRTGNSAAASPSDGLRADARAPFAGVKRGLIPLLFMPPPSGMTYVVTTAADNLDNASPTPGSLCAAIRDANLNSGPDTIEFNIPGAGPHTISVGAGLPVITDALTIDGYSQPGASPNTLAVGNDAVLKIEIKDQTLSQGFALTIGASDCVVQGLVIHGFNTAIWIDGSRTNAGASRNVVRGNFIGTNVAGTAVSADYSFSAAGNLGGVSIDGGGFKPDGTPGTANNNLIGGTNPAARNLISGNAAFAVRIGKNIAAATATGNLIQGNYIGTNAQGTAALGNGDGVTLGAPGNTIGGTADGARNVISGNNYNSLFSSGISACCGANDNLIQGNYIGTDATGTVAIPNAVHGVFLNSNARNNTVGGASAAARNVISGNVQAGVFLTSSGNKVQGNYIGTDATGTQALANGFNGVQVSGATSAIVGGLVLGEGNVISANARGGIDIASDNVFVQGNFIGTQADGTSPLGNAQYGVRVGGANNLIGGRASGAGNRIAFSKLGFPFSDAGSGVIVFGGDTNVTVVGNSIHSSEGLGIDLGRDGLTANDACDFDSNSGTNNRLQNYPVLTSAASGGGTTTIAGTLDSAPGTTFTLDFYANAACDATGFGEGQTYLGSASVTTDPNCDASFTAMLPVAVPAGQVITATATDPSGNTSEFSACVQVTLVNSPPDAVDDSATTNEDTPVSVNVLANDTEPDGDTVTISSFTQGASGSVTENGDGTLGYTPNANFNGSDSFYYSVSDSNGGTDSATVTVLVNAVADPPDAVNDTATTTEDAGVTISVLANDANGDCGGLIVTAFTQPAHGSASLNPNGTVTYTPRANFNGADSFRYTVGCGQSGASATFSKSNPLSALLKAFQPNAAAEDSDEAEVSVSVTPVNDPPDAMDDAVTTQEDTPVTLDVLANDTDVENDAFIVTGFTQPAHGAVSANADGTLTYTPNNGFSGTDSFTYQIGDGHGGADSATVSVTVNRVNSPPDAVDDEATTDEDTNVTINARANDADGNCGAVSVSDFTQGAHGAVAFFNGAFSYTPATDFNGTDSFTYTLRCAGGDTDTATVTVTVNPVNDAPVAADDSYTTDEDTTLRAAAPGVLGNDSDAEGNALAALLVTSPRHGALAWNADGSFDYTPAADPAAGGTDSFTYRANDGSLSSNVTTVRLTINPVNDPPVAADDSYSTNRDTPLSVPAPGVLSNDADADSPTLTALFASGPANGALTLNADGSFTYTPTAGFAGADSFTYRASDGAATSNTATVTIVVTAANPTWFMTGSLSSGRIGHTATLLSDGNVLVVGGSSNFRSAELYDPRTGRWSRTADLNDPRLNHTATLLPDGKVLVAGGGTADGNQTNFLASSELYDPTAGTWSRTGNMTVARALHTATLLPDGRVLAAGGSNNNTGFGNVELYDPATGRWVRADGNDTQGRGHTATLLPNGNILFVGDIGSRTPAESAELYDPRTGFWRVSFLNDARFNHTATLLPNGRVLVAGGSGATALNSAELYDPLEQRWIRTGSLNHARSGHTATLLPNGKVLVVGGEFIFFVPSLTSSELYDPATGTWSTTASLNIGRSHHTATRLSDGRVLAAGGRDGLSGPTDTSELYGLPDPTCAFAISPTSQNFGASGGTDAVNVTTTSGCNWTATSNAAWLAVTSGASGSGSGTVRYTVAANTGAARTGTLSVAGRTFVVTQSAPVNNAPVAVDDNYVLDGPSLTIGAPGILANDSDIDGDPLTVRLVTGPTSGTLTLNPDGSFTYTPGASFAGCDSFDYHARDGRLPHDNGISNNATVSITGSPASGPQAISVLASQQNESSAQAKGFDAFGKLLSPVAVGADKKPLAALNSSTAEPSWGSTANLSAARVFHTATLLRDGRVLVVGGTANAVRSFFTGRAYLKSAEVYDPATRTWQRTGELRTARGHHTAALLPDGKVLVAGGVGANGVLLRTAEVYDPATGRWTPTGSLNVARAGHTATLVPTSPSTPGGKVLIAAGVGNGLSVLNSAEVYDHATGTWTRARNLSAGRWAHTATFLPNGKVLVAGGYGATGPFVQSTAELYDPATDTWTRTAGNMSAARGHHTATLLQGGRKVLLAGGLGQRGVLSATELYDSSTDTFTPTGGRLNTGRWLHTATLLRDGRMLAAGGNGDGNFGLFVTNTVELYDPATDSWARTGSLNVGRHSQTATLLYDNKVLAAGGMRGGATLGAAELYDPLDSRRLFSTCDGVTVTAVHGEGFHGNSRVARIENGRVPCMHAETGEVGECAFDTAGVSAGLMWVEAVDGQYAKTGQAITPQGEPGGDWIVAARVNSDGTVPCVAPSGNDTAGAIAGGAELGNVCVIEEVGVEWNTLFAYGWFPLLNYADGDVCTSTSRHPDGAQLTRTINSCSGTVYCYSYTGAALNDRNGAERDATGTYFTGENKCHFLRISGYEVPAAKRPATRSLPAPGSVNVNTPLLWRPVNPNVDIANRLLPSGQP